MSTTDSRPPRSSTSSHPSATSSITPITRYSNYDEDTGDESGSGDETRRKPGRIIKRYLGEDGHLDGDPSRYARTEGSDHSRGAGRRIRRSGGFLLEPTFSGQHEERVTPLRDDRKGKRRDNNGYLDLPKRRTMKARPNEGVGYGRSPLSRQLGEQQDNEEGLHAQQDHPYAGGIDTSKNNDVGVGHRRHVPEKPAQSAYTTTTGINPAELVSMALSLSEGRRRNFSAGQYSPPAANAGKRTASVRLTQAPPNLLGSFRNYTAGDGLRYHLQEQRRVSRNLSPGARKSSARSPPEGSAPSALGNLPSNSQLIPQEPLVEYAFSEATLNRAAKFRSYMELSNEYRRLLQYLPPLKSDAYAPGNMTISTIGAPGSANFFLQRVPSHYDQKYDLGRPYNPLQYVRNRRVRARERRAIDEEAEGWNDVRKVKSWVDIVGHRAEQPSFRSLDAVVLPEFSDAAGGSASQPSNAPEQATGQKRTNTVSTKPKRPRMDWTFTPAELLADAFWLEQGDNKALVEDRHGHKIFPAYAGQRTHASDQSDSQNDRRRRSAVDMDFTSQPDSGLPTDKDANGDRGRKKHSLLQPHRGNSHSSSRVKRVLRRSRNNSPSSRSLSSSDDEHSPEGRRPSRRLVSGEENTGPLEKHLSAMIDEEHQNQARRSVDVYSPDKWDWGHKRDSISAQRQSPNRMSHKEGSRLAQHEPAGAHLKALPNPLHLLKRSHNPTPSLDGVRHSVSSIDDLGSTAPNSPAVPTFSYDSSPPLSRQASPVRKHKKSKLSVFRTDGLHGDSDVSRVDFGATDGDAGSSRQASRQSREDNKESHTTARSSLEVPEAHHARRLSRDHHRPDGFVNPDYRPESRGGKDGKSTQSAFSRLLRGGRIGELVRSEGSRMTDFIWKKESIQDGAISSVESHGAFPDGSDVDDDGTASTTQTNRNSMSLRDDASFMGTPSTSQPDQLHRNDLPSFKSAFAPPDASAEVKVDDNLTNGSRLDSGASRRPSRFNRLAPPRIDMTNVSPNSSTDGLEETLTQEALEFGDTRASSSSRTRTRLPGTEDRMLEGLRAPGTRPFGRIGVPVTALSRLEAGSGRAENKAHDPRHWSISNHVRQAKRTAVCKTDIARVRALFLSSGIKANEIVRRAGTQRAAGTPKFLQEAADTARAPLYPVAIKEEHVLAARILSNDIASSMQKFEAGLERFRNKVAAPLAERLGALQECVNEDLTPKVHACADDADAFTLELSTRRRLEIKSVNDAVDAMLRRRRKRFRWVRRVGWVLLEWALLGIMWWVWLVFIIFRLFRGVVVGFVRGIRWVLWLW